MIRLNTVLITTIMAVLTHTASAGGEGELAFLEEDGLIVIEMETNDNIPENWAMEVEFDDFTGDSYLRYDGPNSFGTPGNDLMSYRIFIQNPGIYRFQWRNLIAEGTSTTDSNDSWLKIEADAFYGQRNNSIVCPRGYDSKTNDCPIELDEDGNVTPNGTGGNGWFKIYRSGTGQWIWFSRTSDSDSHPIFARFDRSGLYNILVSGRSKNHAIDRMVLYSDAYEDDPNDITLDQSLRIDADLIFEDGFE